MSSLEKSKNSILFIVSTPEIVCNMKESLCRMFSVRVTWNVQVHLVFSLIVHRHSWWFRAFINKKNGLIFFNSSGRSRRTLIINRISINFFISDRHIFPHETASFCFVFPLSSLQCLTGSTEGAASGCFPRFCSLREQDTHLLFVKLLSCHFLPHGWEMTSRMLTSCSVYSWSKCNLHLLPPNLTTNLFFWFDGRATPACS